MKELVRTRNKTKLTLLAVVGGYVSYAVMTAGTWHLIDGIDLIFHEAGHTIFFFLGEFIQVAAGSVFQIFLPLLFVFYFYRHQDLYSSAILLLWVGQSIVNVSVYAGDAVSMNLPLLGGDGSIHDWNYLLSHLGLLAHAKVVAGGLYMLGLSIVISGIFAGFIYADDQKFRE